MEFSTLYCSISLNSHFPDLLLHKIDYFIQFDLFLYVDFSMQLSIKNHHWPGPNIFFRDHIPYPILERKSINLNLQFLLDC